MTKEKKKIFDDWCYVIETFGISGSFFNKTTKQGYSRHQFNLQTQHLVPRVGTTKDGLPKYLGKPSNITMLYPDMKIDLVEKVEYAPDEKEATFVDKDNLLTLNLFRHDLRPKPAESISAEGQKDIDLFLKHLRLIFTTEKNVKVFLDWVAYHRQHPGKKILWCPIIVGTEGFDKNLLIKFLESIIGMENVTVNGKNRRILKNSVV